MISRKMFTKIEDTIEMDGKGSNVFNKLNRNLYEGKN